MIFSKDDACASTHVQTFSFSRLRRKEMMKPSPQKLDPETYQLEVNLRVGPTRQLDYLGKTRARMHRLRLRSSARNTSTSTAFYARLSIEGGSSDRRYASGAYQGLGQSATSFRLTTGLYDIGDAVYIGSIPDVM